MSPEQAESGQPRPFPHKHLLSIADLSREDILQILNLADTFADIAKRPIKKVPTLRGRTVINFFLENSTRTRVSFELAAKRMSADAINISGSGSSAAKGETIVDTAKNLMAMAPDVIVLRHPSSGAAALVAAHVSASVINAGDGTHEHPTQALLDCATIREHKCGEVNGSSRNGFEGLEVAIVGDIEHSRVARSNILALTKLGANVRVCGPATLLPVGLAALVKGPGKLSQHLQLEPALRDADVVMMLRVQNERLGNSPRFANTREYSRYYGLNLRTVEAAKTDAIIMHPGPINRGVEMMPDVADGNRSVILQQVTYGIAVRMAVLYLLGTPGEPG